VRRITLCACLAALSAPSAGCSRARAHPEGAPSPPPALAVGERPAPAAPAPAPSIVSPPERTTYSVVLHTGDSTVGGRYGLARALKARFERDGARYVGDTVNGASLLRPGFAAHVGSAIARHKPDLVLINLGTNEVFVPAPQSLEGHIRAIVREVGRCDCVWIGPPTWRGDRGLVQVIRANAAPCRFFDSSNLDMERRRDGIHPTDKGGEQWAERLWPFFREP
jgi:lysophospholipase L1-like esterase